MVFNLYRSGIHYAKIHWNEKPALSKRNFYTGKWEKTRPLTEEEDALLLSLFQLSILEFFKLHPKLEGFINTSHTSAEIDGHVYDKFEEDRLIERQKKFPMDIFYDKEGIYACLVPNRESTSLLVREGKEEKTILKEWSHKSYSPASYLMQEKITDLIPMRDKVRLATDIYLPKDCEEALPTILIRTPYNKDTQKNVALPFVCRGFAVVVQDVRGRETSEGVWEPFAHEVTDGEDSLQWIAEQAWSNQKIGMLGGSYLGFVQWAAASTGSPYLSAMASIVTAGSPFGDLPRRGGSYLSGALPWFSSLTDKNFEPAKMLRDDWAELMAYRPLKNLFKDKLNGDFPYWEEMFEHEAYDEFWARQDWTKRAQNIKAPALIISGWFDDNGEGTTEALRVVEGYEKQNKRILLGPWTHGANTQRDLQGFYVGPAGLRYDIDLEILRWFDIHLKGKTFEEFKEKEPVSYYSTGDFKWRKAGNWPPEEVRSRDFFLSAEEKRGRLTYTAEDKASLSYRYDPCNPFPQLINPSDNDFLAPADYSQVEKREDVLVFSGEILEAPLTIAGSPEVSLFIDIDVPDTDFIVKLTDVDEEGRSFKLADGILRSKFYKGFDRELFAEPGEIREYRFAFTKIAHCFQKGHRIRLLLSSSAEAYVFENYNSRERSGDVTTPTTGTIRLHMGGDYPSRLILPVLEE